MQREFRGVCQLTGTGSCTATSKPTCGKFWNCSVHTRHECRYDEMVNDCSQRGNGFKRYLLMQLELRESIGTMLKNCQVDMKQWLCRMSEMLFDTCRGCCGELERQVRLIAQVFECHGVTSHRRGAVLDSSALLQAYPQRACSSVLQTSTASARAGKFAGEGMMALRQS
jgi:hypothetical protein